LKSYKPAPAFNRAQLYSLYHQEFDISRETVPLTNGSLLASDLTPGHLRKKDLKLSPLDVVTGNKQTTIEKCSGSIFVIKMMKFAVALYLQWGGL